MWTLIGMIAIAYLIFVLIENGGPIGMRLESLCKNQGKVNRLSNVWLSRTLLILAANAIDLSLISPVPEIGVSSTGLFSYLCL